MSENLLSRVKETKPSELKSSESKETKIKIDNEKKQTKNQKSAPEQISDIFKEEINQLKQLAKEAGSIIKQDQDSTNGVSNKEKESPIKIKSLPKDIKSVKKEENTNGPMMIKDDLLINNTLDEVFLQERDTNITKGQESSDESKQIKINSLTQPKNKDLKFDEEEDEKTEFEEKFNYLINKLDTIYKVTQN
jgi:hypothetical protein